MVNITTAEDLRLYDHELNHHQHELNHHPLWATRLLCMAPFWKTTVEATPDDLIFGFFFIR